MFEGLTPSEIDLAADEAKRAIEDRMIAESGLDVVTERIAAVVDQIEKKVKSVKKQRDDLRVLYAEKKVLRAEQLSKIGELLSTGFSPARMDELTNKGRGVLSKIKRAAVSSEGASVEL